MYVRHACLTVGQACLTYLWVASAGCVAFRVVAVRCVPRGPLRVMVRMVKAVVFILPTGTDGDGPYEGWNR